MAEKNIFVNNDFVKEYVRLHTLAKTTEQQMKDMTVGLTTGTYVYQGVEAITSSVTLYSRTTKKVKEGYEKEAEELLAQIDELKAKYDALTESVQTDTICARVTKAPKGLNK